jgi:flagellar biosynthesis protein FlhA
LLTFGEVLRVLRNLLRESVSIRDLRSILEALTELAPQTRDPEQLTELSRQRLSSDYRLLHGLGRQLVGPGARRTG